jgi:hypothetical protein
VGETDTGHRMGSFVVGLAITMCSAFSTWFVFLLLTMKMNPALAGNDYWVEVRERAVSNLPITVLLGMCCFGVLVGLVTMGRAAVRRHQKLEKPGATAEDGGV